MSGPVWEVVIGVLYKGLERSRVGVQECTICTRRLEEVRGRLSVHRGVRGRALGGIGTRPELSLIISNTGCARGLYTTDLATSYRRPATLFPTPPCSRPQNTAPCCRGSSPHNPPNGKLASRKNENKLIAKTFLNNKVAEIVTVLYFHCTLYFIQSQTVFHTAADCSPLKNLNCRLY